MGKRLLPPGDFVDPSDLGDVLSLVVAFIIPIRYLPIYLTPNATPVYNTPRAVMVASCVKDTNMDFLGEDGCVGVVLRVPRGSLSRTGSEKTPEVSHRSPASMEEERRDVVPHSAKE